MEPASDKGTIAIHLVMSRESDKEKVLTDIRKKLNSSFGTDLIIKEFKIRKDALPSSGTTAKYDTVRMLNDDDLIN